MRSMRHLQTAGIFASLVMLLGPLGARAQTASTVFERVKDSVFVVKTLDAKGVQKALGSAVLLPSGKFVTNFHVVQDGAKYQVGRGKEFATATYFAGDSGKDVCLLDAPGLSGKPAVLGSAASLKVGQPVYAVGAPQGLELSISEGIVSQLRGAPPPMIQTTAAISPGSSGGGLFDSAGRLVGLTVLYIEGGQNLNFALPVEWIAEVKPGMAAPAREPSEGAWMARASQFDTGKDWPSLRDWCQIWIKNEPESEDAWCWLGSAYLGLQRPSDAVEAYRQAVRFKPEYAGAWSNLGIAYKTLGRSVEAIDAFHRALRINSELAIAWYNLGNTYQALGQSTEAIDAYGQAVRVNPEDAGTWCNLGTTYEKLGRSAEAINAYRRALRINPGYVGAWSNLGNAYRNLGRSSEAIDAYRQALRINPEFVDAWFNLGTAYFEAGNTAAALDAVKALRRLNPTMADELLNIIVPP